MYDQNLSQVIATALGRLEGDGDLVITSPIGQVADQLAEAALAIVPNTALSDVEMAGVRSLILNAISDKRFFDWEMPTLTGFNAVEFEQIAEKLPRA